jgi:hypothetical protein
VPDAIAHAAGAIWEIADITRSTEVVTHFRHVADYPLGGGPSGMMRKDITRVRVYLSRHQARRREGQHAIAPSRFPSQTELPHCLAPACPGSM